MTTTPTRAQMREDLARAMGWIGLRLMKSQMFNEREDLWGLRPGEAGQVMRKAPDPFTSAADNRALGWTEKSHFPDSFQPHFWIAPSGRTNQSPPDPFTSAEANRKLVEWLATQSGEVQRVFVLTLRDEVIERDICYELALLTAPLETIAEAAWRAIQEEAK